MRTEKFKRNKPAANVDQVAVRLSRDKSRIALEDYAAKRGVNAETRAAIQADKRKRREDSAVSHVSNS